MLDGLVLKNLLEKLLRPYTRPPSPPILGGNGQSLRLSPSKIGGLGGLMQN